MADAWNTTPTYGAQLVQGERVLAAAGSLAPWQEAVELLSYALDVPIPVLLAQPATHLRPADVLRYGGLVRRRVAGEALPRITGHVAFMGLDLAIGRADPLIPPDAERRAQIALEWGRHHAPGELAVAEIGTGCGALALALAALEPRFTRIFAVDHSAATLETATANGARYLLNLVISWLMGEGLDAVPERVDLIVCGRLDQGAAAAGSQGERAAEVVSLREMHLLKQAPGKMRPGGALIWSLDRAREAETLAVIDLAFPDAQVWVDPQASGAVIAVVQLPVRPEGDGMLDNGG